jgi:hypothetical protein
VGQELNPQVPEEDVEEQTPNVEETIDTEIADTEVSDAENTDSGESVEKETIAADSDAASNQESPEAQKNHMGLIWGGVAVLSVLAIVISFIRKKRGA